MLYFFTPKKKKNMRMYLASFILLESFLIGTFSSIDLFSFYIFFESILIPMYLIIGFWGGERRIYSAYKFFLYTLLGSVLMLIAIIFLYQSLEQQAYQDFSTFPSFLYTSMVMVSIFCFFCS